MNLGIKSPFDNFVGLSVEETTNLDLYKNDDQDGCILEPSAEEFSTPEVGNKYISAE